MLDAPLDEMTVLTVRITHHLLDSVLLHQADQDAHSFAHLLDHGNHDLWCCYMAAYDRYLAATHSIKPATTPIDNNLRWNPLSAMCAIVYGVANASFGHTKANTVDMALTLALLPSQFMLNLVQDNCQDAFANMHAHGTLAMSTLAMDSLASAMDCLSDIDVMAGSLYGCYSDALSNDVAHYLTAHTMLTCQHNTAHIRLIPFYPPHNSIMPLTHQPSSTKTVALPANIQPPHYNTGMHIVYDCTRWDKLMVFHATASVLQAHDMNFFCIWDHQMPLILRLVSLMKAAN